MVALKKKKPGCGPGFSKKNVEVPGNKLSGLRIKVLHV